MSTITRDIERRTGRDLLVAHVELRQDDVRGLFDGFSVTGSLWLATKSQTGWARRARGRDIDGGGCLHDEILAAFPELAPVVHVHLAEPDGTPMHAVANGWYFYSGAASRWEAEHPRSWHNPEGLSDVERAARTLRMPADEIPAGIPTREAFDVYCRSLAGRWRRDAAAARAAILALPTEVDK